MRKLKVRLLAGGLLGSVVGFLFAFLDDMAFTTAEAHRLKTHKPDPNAWAVWAFIGGVAGVSLGFVPSLARAALRHPVGTLAGLFLIAVRTVFKGVDVAERRLSTTSLGESPSLQPTARSAFPLPAAADDFLGIGASE